MSTDTSEPRMRGAFTPVWRAGAVAVELVAAGLAFATLLAFGARLLWACELIVHWRMVLGLLLVAAAAVSFVARHPRRASVALLFALINGWFVAPLLFEVHATLPPRPVALRLFHANVNIASHDTPSVARAIEASDADVVVLQEVGPRWLAELAPTLVGYPYRLELPREHPFGIAVYSRLEFQNSEVVLLGDHASPSIAVRVMAPGGVITVLATHPRPPVGPWSNGLRNEQLAAIAEFATQTLGTLVVVGDLNTSPLAPSFQDLVTDSGLADAGRGFGWQGTWPAPLPAPLRIRLDHVLHSKQLVVRQFEVQGEIGSDHRPIVVALDFVAREP